MDFGLQIAITLNLTPNSDFTIIFNNYTYVKTKKCLKKMSGKTEIYIYIYIFLVDLTLLIY